MNKIILVQINYSQDHSEKVLPLGILSVGSSLKRAGYDVELINITEREIDQTVKRVIAQSPLYVGLTVMTGVQTRHSAEFSKKIKQKSKIPVIWGGIHPSLLPKQCLQEDYIDYVVISEGEISIIDLTQKIIDGKEPLDVPGIAYKKDNQVVINSWRSFINNLDDYRSDFSLIDPNEFIFPLSQYKRVFVYKASRGCPFNCAFCYNNAFNQNKWRFWSVEAVVKDINWLKQSYQIDAIKFYDDNFFVDKSRALAILEQINLPAHVEIRIDSLDDNLAGRLKELKVFDMLIGVESGSNRLLKMIDKNFTVDKILETVKIIAKYDLPATYSAIVGLPTETKEEFEATIDLFYNIYKIHSKAVFSLGAYLPYPGSKMYDFAISEGFNPPERTEDWGNIDRFRQDFSSPWVDAKKVWRIREYFKFLNWKLGPVIWWFKWRIKHRFFMFPVDIYVIEYLSSIALEQKGIIGKLMRKTYNLIKHKKVNHGL
jgi:anaerobic magnesium-protoporphyrin IX monomethyl ester cyclase